MANSVKKFASLLVTYDQSLGLMNLIQRALGPDNIGNYTSDITPERFPLKGTDVRTVQARVEPFLDGETGEQAAKRLVAAGHTLANTGDLAGYLASYPKEVEKWKWVFALSEDSRWAFPYGGVGVPCAFVRGAFRDFRLDYFRRGFYSVDGVLVFE
jgi:broad specificity phosphatase PhoE